jgi:hypothetical protein
LIIWLWQVVVVVCKGVRDPVAVALVDIEQHLDCLLTLVPLIL